MIILRGIVRGIRVFAWHFWGKSCIFSREGARKPLTTDGLKTSDNHNSGKLSRDFSLMRQSCLTSETAESH